MEYENLENAVVAYDASYFTNEENIKHWGDTPSFTIAKMVVAEASFVDVILSRGALEAIKANCVFAPIFAEALSRQTASPLDKIYAIRDLVDEKLSDSASPETHLQLLLVGIAALLGFCQSNWTGPAIPNYTCIIPELTPADAIADLTVDGETGYKRMVTPELLLLARAILVSNIQNFRNSKSKSLWSARCSFKHQEMLSGPSEALRVHLTAQFNKAMFAYPEDPRLSVEFGLYYYYYQDSVRSRDYFFKAKDATGLVADLSGMLGRRTKYQTFDTAQLVLLAKSKADASGEDKSSVPTEVKHEDTWDEGSLARPNLKDEEATAGTKALTEVNLSLMDQCILIALCLNVKNENPRHGLTWEEMKAYIDRVLKNPNNWMIHSMALLVKGRLESLRERTADRAAMQIQVLVDQFNETDQEDSKVPIRLKHLFYLAWPPRHLIELEVGKIYLSLGIARTAMAIFEKLEYWNEVIECMQICKDFDGAMKLVQDRIKVDGETPELLCLLGDVQSKNEEKVASYKRAWEVSKGRFAKAKRQLGVMSMNEGKWPDAIAHLKQALAINPQYVASWFRLGVCGMATNDFQLAAAAFSRVTSMAPDDGEAWNNLASSLIKLNKLKEAYGAFKEALKHHESWRIWDNFVVVCMKIGHYGEAIYGLNRLLDLKEKHVDIDVLGMLVTLVTEKELQSDERVETVHKYLKEYMARLTSQVSNDPELWKIYSFYYERLDNREKAAEYRQRQVRALSSGGAWEKDADKFKQLVDAVSRLIDNQELIADKNPLHASILSIRSWLRRAQDTHGEGEDWQRLQQILKRAEDAENKGK